MRNPYYDFRDAIMNRLARFAMRHCCLDYFTCVSAIHKMTKGEVESFLQHYDEDETMNKVRKFYS